jgi:tryptophan-rich sensory protein
MEVSDVLADWNWNRKTAKGLVANLAIALIVVLVGNGLIFTLIPRTTDSSAPSLLNPPGWLVGAVWVPLFEAMATARWLVLDGDDRRVKSSAWIMMLLLFCLAYPAYTLGLQSLTIGLIGNIATIVAALWVAVRVYRASRAAAGLISCVIAWLVFATVVTLVQIQGHSA